MTMPKPTKQHLNNMRQLDERMGEENRISDFNRARAVSVGTAFGGVTEISMRANEGRTIWAVMQPVEVVELIHQLAGNIGCHIHLKPRDDFASWRNWRVTPEEKAQLNGHPPFVSDMHGHIETGRQLPKAEAQPGLQPELMARSNENEFVATKKTVNRRSTKRTAKAS